MCAPTQRQVYTTPVLVERLGHISQITVGSASPSFFPFICGINADDSGVYCLGENSNGQLGTGMRSWCARDIVASTKLACLC